MNTGEFILTAMVSSHLFLFIIGVSEMKKTISWILAFGLILLFMQYSLFKENGEPRVFIPAAVAK